MTALVHGIVKYDWNRDFFSFAVTAKVMPIANSLSANLIASSLCRNSNGDCAAREPHE
jgi:hypothetical protein